VNWCYCLLLYPLVSRSVLNDAIYGRSIGGQSAKSIRTNPRHSKRVFLLGPSHHFYLEKAALTRCTHYGTPLGNLPIDAATTADLHKTGQFDWMSQDVDEDEHSLEMHLPYIYKMLSK